MRRFLQSLAVFITAVMLATLAARAAELWKTLPALAPLPPVLPGLSHFAMLQDPQAFTQAVLDFLK